MKIIVANWKMNNGFDEVDDWIEGFYKAYSDNLKNEKLSTNFESDKKYIVSIGRLTYQKNFNLLIESFYEIKKIYNDYKLIIIGEG